MSDFSIGFDFEENEFTKNIFEGLELLNFIACNNYYGDAIAGSAQSGDAAIAGAFVVIVLNNATNAYIGDGAVLNIRGNINIDSKSDVNAKAFGGAVAFANKAGVGITTVNIINFDAVRAYIGEEAIVISDGNIRIVADADQEFTIISVSAGGASKAGVSGVFDLLLNFNSSEAYIGSNAEVKAECDILINASNDTEAYLVAGGGAGGGTAGVGGSIAVIIARNNTLAYIADDSMVDAGGTLSINALNNLLSISAVISGAGGGKAGVAASLSVKTIESNTLAYIGPGAVINGDPAYRTTDQAISITAVDDSILVGVVGSGAGGGSAGVGASSDTTVLLKTVKAYIADATDELNGVKVTATKNIIIAAESSENVISVTAGFAGGGSAGVGGAVTVVVTTNDIEAYIGQSAVVSTNGSIAISAEEDLVLVIIAGSGAGGGSAGVGASVAVSTVVNTVKAYIGNNAQVTALGNGDAVSFYTGAGGKEKSDGRGVLIGAYSTEDVILTVVSGAGGGSAGAAASMGVSVIKNTTQAYIGDGSKVNINNEGANVAQEVRVIAADDTVMVDMVGGGAGGGSAGVGASIDVVVLVKTTQAYIGSGAYVAAQKDINVSSLSQDVITSIVVGGAGGGSAGVAGTVSVVVVSNLTEAYTGAAGLIPWEHKSICRRL